MAVRTPDHDPTDPTDQTPADPDVLLHPGWLTDAELDGVRERVPVVYVEAVPVTLDSAGRVSAVGVLLRANSEAVMTRTIVSGRVRYGETIRDALLRHMVTDLGESCGPQLPVSPVPFTVAEYFPMPGISAFVDPRQHAVSLAFIVPVTGLCHPRRDALEVSWLSPAEAADPGLNRDMEGGRGALLRMALASVGALG